MEATMDKLTRDCYKKVYSDSFSREETAEYVVPDVMPDIAEIIDTGGVAFLRSKEVSDGKINLGATVTAFVLYMPEDGSGVKKLSINVPFTENREAPEVDEDSAPVADIRLEGLDAVLLNPRKILVKANLSMALDSYAPSGICLYTGIDPGEEISGVQLLKDSGKMSPVSAVREKTFVVSDEYPVPSLKPTVGELLSYNAGIETEDVKAIGNKLVVKGVAKVSIFYLGAEEGCSSCDFSTDFSQIVELDTPGENMDVQVLPLLTGAYVESSDEGHTINVELHAVVQTVCTGNEDIDYIADAYSNTYPLEISRENVELHCTERRATLRETLRGTIDTSAPVKEILNIYSRAGRPKVSGGTVELPICVCAIYISESGGMRRAKENFKIESRIEIDGNMELKVTGVRCDDIYSAPAPGGLEFRMPVEIDVLITSKKPISMITSMDIEKEQRRSNAKRPSVTVVRADGNRTLWDLAKTYGSTIQLIERANDLGESMEIPERQLLIPTEK